MKTQTTKKRLLLLAPIAAGLLLLLPNKVRNGGYSNAATSRGLRNNNPGCLKKTEIKWQGKVSNPAEPVFETFDTMSNGVRAAVRNAFTQWNRGKDTINTLIHTWAPATENRTAAYVAAVAKAAKIHKDKEFKFGNNETTVQIMYAIFLHESGPEAKKYITQENIRGHLAGMFP